MLVTGVGGNGVVTIGALMGMAAHLEGKGVLVLDMAGLAQKGGAVLSHVRLAATPEGLHAARVPARCADLVLGCDLMVAAGKDAVATMDRERTHALLNTDVAPTGAFTQDPDWHVSPEAMHQRVREATRGVDTIAATTLAGALIGDAVATNVFLLGYAWQKGWVPLGEAALGRAIELNGAAVAMNKAAFAWGRQAAIDPSPVRAAAGLTAPAAVIILPARMPSLDALLVDRSQRLTVYQNAAYAKRYEQFVREIAAAEAQRVGGDRLAREVGWSLYQLMAYKDEYEVARLYVESGFFGRVAREFEGDFRLNFHLAPPLLSKRDSHGHLIKRKFGPWVATAFRWLAKARGLRGTPFDLFGHTAERRSERAAIDNYMALLRRIVAKLSSERLETALALARLPRSVRGYGHVKHRNAVAAQASQQALLAEFEGLTSSTSAAHKERHAA